MCVCRKYTQSIQNACMEQLYSLIGSEKPVFLVFYSQSLLVLSTLCAFIVLFTTLSAVFPFFRY